MTSTAQPVHRFLVRVTGQHAYAISRVSVTYSMKVQKTTSVQVWVCDAYCD